MNKEFIPYQQALELKELGFDEPCFNYYVPSLQGGFNLLHSKINLDDIKAPLYQQAFRWFREKYDLIVAITKVSSIINYTFVAVFYKGDDDHFIGSYNTYEEAELACLKELIEIAKNK